MAAKVNQVPESCRGLDRAAVKQALVSNAGNVTATARKLGVPSGDLRVMVQSSSLVSVAYDQLETDLDNALQVIFEGLRSPDKALKRQAAHIMLTRTDAGRARGFGAVGYVPTGRPLGGPKKYCPLDARFDRRSPDDGSGSRKS